MINLDNSAALILVVDDDEAARLMMTTTLEKAGLTVLAAADCSQARALFAEFKFDVVLLDVLLPDGDGFSLCKEFLRQPKGRDLPVAMVTGLDDLESIQLGYQSGATDFITKPVSWGTLPYRIQYILQGSRALIDLSVSESKTRALLSSIPDILMRIHRDGWVLDMQVGSMLFNIQEWFYSVEGETYGRLPPEVNNAVANYITAALNGEGMQLLEFQWSQELDKVCFWEARIQQRDDNEVLMVVRDITQRKQQENQMRLSAKVFDGTGEAILITDANLNIISVNRAYQNITGYSQAEILASNKTSARNGLHHYSFFEHIVAVLKERGHWQGELLNERKNGEFFPCWFSINQVLDAHGEPENYIAIFNDITEHKNSRAKIDFLAHHDSLTGLPNRTLLNDRIEMAINVASREHKKLGVLFLDLDRFKNINDSLGHLIGDQILKETANRLTAVIRSGDTVSRLGGDEFVVLFPTINDESNLAELTLKISVALQQPYLMDGITLHITPSIGIAIYPDDGDTFDLLIKNADAAMYLAKERGRNNYQFYTPALNARTLDRLRLESGLRKALELGHFELHYQPLIAGDGSIRGAEALIRWRHPERGLIPPMDFIPLAEETGLIIPLGEWVLAEAARQVKQWHQQGYTELVVSVNISALQFKQPEFLARVDAILKTVGVEPKSVELELTESILMGDMDASIKILQQFCDRGYLIAIDDFGTGFSSLSYLRHLPVHLLKIDKSFVHDMMSESASLAIVDSIIGLAHALGKETIAEGVETEDEYKLLLLHGCRLMQGYYFAKPLPAVEFERWVTTSGRYVMRSDVL